MNKNKIIKKLNDKKRKKSQNQILKDKYTGEVTFLLDIKECVDSYKITAVIMIVMATILMIMYVTDTSKLPFLAAAVIMIIFLIISVPVCLHDISHFCSVIEVKNEKLIIDKVEFDYSKIEDPLMTPFEFHEKKIISFKYEGKKYKYFFGYFTGNGQNEMTVRIYPDICRELIKKGFMENYS